MNVKDSKKGQAIPSYVVHIGKEAFDRPEATEIRWLSGGAAMINARGTVIMIDPVFEGFDMPLTYDPPLKPEEVKRIDGLLVTHIDNDHFSRDTIRDVKNVTEEYHTTQYVAEVMREGADVTLFATGHLVFPALQAADILREQGVSVEVVNIATIKPLDVETILNSVRKTGCAVTAEEHFLNGGMGDAVCQCLCRNLPIPVEMVGVDDVFGQSGTPDELMAHFGLDRDHIVDACRKAISRK